MSMPFRYDRESAEAPVDKRLVGRSFGRAAIGYDSVARLQRQVGDLLLGELPARASPSTMIDVGAGTGYCTRLLMDRFPDSSLMALDLAEGMLRRLRSEVKVSERLSLVCADAENLPLSARVVDLVFSSLALQWCQDVSAAFAEFQRVLKPGGTLVFSSFGPATLAELREAWARVDQYGHVLAFRSPRQHTAALAVAGFRDVVVRSEVKVLSYRNVEALMRELKGLGASNLSADRPRHLMGKKAMRGMIDAYGPPGPDGAIRASFEIIHGCARRV